MSTRKTRTYSAELKSALLSEFTKSNESAASFSKRKGIPSTTFFQWRKKLKEGQQLSPFVEVSLSEPTYVPAAGIHSGSLTLTSPETLSQESLIKILTAMQRAVQ